MKYENEIRTAKLREPKDKGTQAAAWACRGLPIIPLHIPVRIERPAENPVIACSCRHVDEHGNDVECKAGAGKHCVVAPYLELTGMTWKELEGSGAWGINAPLTDPNIISAMWTKRPWMNVGMSTKGVWAIEWDVKPQFEEFGTVEERMLRFCDSMFIDMVTTPTNRSGSGGYHMFFLPPEGLDVVLKANTVDLPDFPGMEFRGGPSIMVLPPSLHKSGERYSSDGSTWYHGLQVAGKRLQAHFLEHCRPTEKRSARDLYAGVEIPNQQQRQQQAHAEDGCWYRPEWLAGVPQDRVVSVIRSNDKVRTLWDAEESGISMAEGADDLRFLNHLAFYLHADEAAIRHFALKSRRTFPNGLDHDIDMVLFTFEPSERGEFDWRRWRA